MTAPAPRKPSKKDILEEVVRRTELPRNTVKELLKAGWIYREGVQEGAFVRGISAHGRH